MKMSMTPTTTLILIHLPVHLHGYHLIEHLHDHHHD